MKRTVSALLCLCLLLSLLALPASAEEAITVCVNLSQLGDPVTGQSGALLIAYPLTLPAGATVDDAFRALHALECPAGEDGYGTLYSYGLRYPGRMWGVDLDAVCFPCVNGEQVLYSSETVLQDGDQLSFSIFDALTLQYYGVADFEQFRVEAAAGETVILRATSQLFSFTTYKTSALALTGGRVLCNGELLEEVMAPDGSVALRFDAPGEYYILANNGTVCGPAMCLVTVVGEALSPEETDTPVTSGRALNARGKYDPENGAYTVAQGDNLWDISVLIYGTGYRWSSIWSANAAKIAKPSIIFAGQVLTIPPL